MVVRSRVGAPKPAKLYRPTEFFSRNRSINGVTVVKNQPPNGVEAMRNANRVNHPGLLVGALKIDERGEAVLLCEKAGSDTTKIGPRL